MDTGRKSRRHTFRHRQKALGLPELVAVALGGMVGGGIFTILGVAVAMVGVYTPLAIAMGTSHGAYKFTRKPTGDILAMDVVNGWWKICAACCTSAI